MAVDISEQQTASQQLVRLDGCKLVCDVKNLSNGHFVALTVGTTADQVQLSICTVQGYQQIQVVATHTQVAATRSSSSSDSHRCR